MITISRSLADVAADVRGCTRCGLCKGRKLAVPGEGPAPSELMFIGEGPGFHENEQGRPFVGPAGKFLQQLLASIGLTRQQVFIANVVKCRPPGNRDPLPEEIAACATFLDEQIAIVRPKVIVTLGRFSMARWFQGESISRIHGQPKNFGGQWVFPCFHPAAALHQEKFRSLIEADFLKIPALLASIAPAEEPLPIEEPPQQLALF
ncbi:MAG TPA: uracil-DNA glycosylase [Chloroflexota bacterium]|nr:uracil-DNA glycosylase [Chloroflexota bacterium]